MAITGGFGWRLDLERGTLRQWAMGRNGVQLWTDNNQPVEPEPEKHDEEVEE
jgi:hypothetical protein